MDDKVRLLAEEWIFPIATTSRLTQSSHSNGDSSHFSQKMKWSNSEDECSLLSCAMSKTVWIYTSGSSVNLA
jgi:hypothetical protein